MEYTSYANYLLGMIIVLKYRRVPCHAMPCHAMHEIGGFEAGMAVLKYVWVRSSLPYRILEVG